MSDYADHIAELPDLADAASAEPLSLKDFCAYAAARACIYLPCKTPWPNASVDKRLPRQPLLDSSGNPVRNSKGKITTISASMWLEQHQSVETMTWAPGYPEFIHGKLAVDGGWVEKPGATTLNTYRPPAVELGDASQAQRWVDLWRTLYPEDADHIVAWFASRVQHPEVKINHALVLGGEPKIGKDTLLEAVVAAVGEWNFHNITLNHLVSRNNDFLRAVIVRLSEARDVGEQGPIDRYKVITHASAAL
jgi:hypothetical protein